MTQVEVTEGLGGSDNVTPAVMRVAVQERANLKKTNEATLKTTKVVVVDKVVVQNKSEPKGVEPFGNQSGSGVKKNHTNISRKGFKLHKYCCHPLEL